MMMILGIETSCDETAAAIITEDGTILSNVIASQIETHRAFGGVVPEVAARAHLEKIDLVIEQALTEASVTLADLDAVAVTAGPGLIGGVIVGVMAAKAIASVQKIPFIPVNHLEGHALTARLTNHVDFPFLLLLVSGGHSQLLTVSGVGEYELLGTTLDDALGEAFDKTAKMLGFPYPGGPEVEAAAKNGDPKRFAFPRPLKGRDGADFSFSGLKTAVHREIVRLDYILSDQDKADVCASFQTAIGDVLKDRCGNAIKAFKAAHPTGKNFVVGGGVAANQYIRTTLTDLAEKASLDFVAPPLKLCTDNAAMIAWVGIEKFLHAQKSGQKLENNMDFAPRPRWPLAE
ncbi:MAG: tRNA (adenosine(37)-N6)-threonylcarbamoyltransferase complex transferase subunit TsaD [Alphaproteobacteria bacterium]